MHALSARHALTQDHALASPKDGGVVTVIPLVLLSARKDCGRPAYTHALSDARASACPTPASYPDFALAYPNSSSPIRNTKSIILGVHTTTSWRS